MPLCRAHTQDGRPCRKPVRRPAVLCYAHDPDHAERRQRIARRGGKARAKRGKRLARWEGVIDDLIRPASKTPWVLTPPLDANSRRSD